MIAGQITPPINLQSKSARKSFARAEKIGNVSGGKVVSPDGTAGSQNPFANLNFNSFGNQKKKRKTPTTNPSQNSQKQNNPSMPRNPIYPQKSHSVKILDQHWKPLIWDSYRGAAAASAESAGELANGNPKLFQTAPKPPKMKQQKLKSSCDQRASGTRIREKTGWESWFKNLVSTSHFSLEISASVREIATKTLGKIGKKHAPSRQKRKLKQMFTLDIFCARVQIIFLLKLLQPQSPLICAWIIASSAHSLCRRTQCFSSFPPKLF